MKLSLKCPSKWVTGEGEERRKERERRTRLVLYVPLGFKGKDRTLRVLVSLRLARSLAKNVGKKGPQNTPTHADLMGDGPIVDSRVPLHCGQSQSDQSRAAV